MDTTSNFTSDVPSNMEHTREVSLATTSSTTSNVVSDDEAKLKHTVAHTLSVPTKRIIRKITHLDPKKLQQAGLDRKIAEALSKQKSQLSSKPSHNFSNALTSPSSVVSSAGTINSTVSKQPTSSKTMHESIPAKNPVITKKIIPPTITITGPEAITQHDTEKLAVLNPQERLVHVKNLLNKKLLQKKGTVAEDSGKNSHHLKPPTQALHPKKLPFKPPKEAAPRQNLFCVLKEPSKVVTTPPLTAARPLKTKTPQKSPQYIARKLDFQTDAESINNEPGNRYSFIKLLNNDMSELKPSKSRRQTKSLPSNPAQFNKQLPQAGQEVLTAKQCYSRPSVSHQPQNFQAEYLKQQKINCRKEIPKAKIKTAQHNSHQPYNYKPLKQSEQKLDFAEVSPLKVPFPTVNVPRETPLPAIESFKKPYPILNSAFYSFPQKSDAPTDGMQADYDAVLLNQQPIALPATSTTSCDDDAAAAAAAASMVGNSLIVLENKVLSQDEMIDLTELRLSTSNFDTPRFMNPHKPIPEVVIKQEDSDEYPVIDISTPVSSLENTTSQAETTKEIQTQNLNVASTERRVAISNKQNKKIIINAQKLKLPPEQLADLAKIIKQKSLANKEAATKAINQTNKLQNIRIVNTKTANTKTTTTNANDYVEPHNIEDVAPTQPTNEMPVKLIIQNKQIYVEKQDETKEFNTIEKTSKLKKENSHDATTNLDHNKSAVEIVDEPLETEDCFSAVDFIAALSNTNPITEETSLELSPEELNLNASCAMNLSPLRIQSYSSNKLTTSETVLKTSTPHINDNNIHQSQQLGTIVIESSKGPETILTKDSPNRLNDTKRAQKLQMAKVFNSMTSPEIEMQQKSSETLSQSDCLRKWQELIVATKTPADNLRNKTVNITSKELDNMDFEKFSDNKLSLSKKPTNTATSRMDTNAINTKDLYQSKAQLDLESKNIIELTNPKLVNNTTNQKVFMSTSALENTTAEDLSQNNLNSKSLLESSSKKEEQQKSEATSSSKRISRFKKGKINLVQRNKMGQGIAIKNLLGNQNLNKTKDISDNRQVVETNDELNTNENREGVEMEPNKSLIKFAKEIFQNEKNILYNVKEVQGSETTNSTHLENDLLQRRSETEAAKIFLSKTFECAIPKASIKMANSTQHHSSSPEWNVAESLNSTKMDIPKASVKIGNPSEQHLKSTEKGLTKAIDNEIDNIPKALIIKTSYSSQPLSNISEKSGNMNIPKASVKTGDILQQQYSKLAVNDSAKSVDSDITNIPKASIKIGHSSQQKFSSPEKCLTKSNEMSEFSNVAKSSIKTSNSTQQLSNSSEKSFAKSFNTDKMDIPKASVKVGNISQQHSNTLDTSLTNCLKSDVRDIPKSSTTSPCNQAKLHVNSPKIYFSLSFNSDNMNTPNTTSVKVGNIPQHLILPDKSFTQTSDSEIVNISKALVNVDHHHTSQQNSNTPEKSLTKSMDNIVITDIESTEMNNSSPQRLNFTASKSEASVEMSNSFSQQHSKSMEITYTKSVGSNIANIPKASIKTSDSSQQQQLRKSTEKSFTKSDSMDIPKASVKVGNSSHFSNSPEICYTSMDKARDLVNIADTTQQILNAQEKAFNKSLNADNMEIPKASVEVGNNSHFSNSPEICYTSMDKARDLVNIADTTQQILNAQEKGFNKSLNADNMEIPKASVKVGNSSHFSNSPEICYTSMDKARDLVMIGDTTQQLSNAQEKGFIKSSNADNMEIPKASVKVGNSLQQSLNSTEISCTKTLNSDSMEIPKALTEVSNNSQQHLNATEKINTDIMDIPKASVNLGNSSQQHLNSTKICLTKSLESENINIPKASITRDPSRSLHQSNSSNISTDKQKIHSTEITPKTLTDESEELLGIHSQEQRTPQTFSKSKEFQKTTGITKSCTNIETQFEHHKALTSLTQQSQVRNLDQDSIKENSRQSENLNQESEAALKTMKNAKVSLVDIVKYSPVKSHEKTSPVLPFKKVFNETGATTGDVKDMTIIVEQIKGNNHQEENKDVISLSKKDEQIVVTSKRTSCRFGAKTCERQTETATPPGSSSSPSIRHSKRPLICDDDLEFLPENVEVKFNLSKSKRNQKNKEATPPSFTSLTTPARNRRKSLYSKPLELDLSSSTLPLNNKRRTRYYSQSLETNVTITFDALKPNLNFLKNTKPLEIEESNGNDCTQDFSTTTATKQRKMLRKTREEAKKDTQISHNATDSEDDNRDYDCEESREFLGFEEISESNSFKNTQHDVKENEQEAKIKHGTLKNWLTTGKAISPTFDKFINIKRLRHDDELPSSSSAIPATQGVVSSKSRWNLGSSLNEDTDITDDTSPADDDEEEEVGKQKSTKKYCKRGTTKNVIDSNKKQLENKKIKLEDSLTEHSFIKPKDLHANTKHQASDSEKEIAGNSQKPQLRGSEENLSQKANKSKEIVLGSKSKEEKETKNSEKVTRNSSAESNSQGKKESSRLKLKCKTKSKEKHSRDTTDTDTDCHDSTEAKQLKLKTDSKTKIKEKDNEEEASNSQDDKKSKSKDVKDNKDKDLDNCVKSNLDTDLAKSKKCRHSRLKPNIEEEKIDNLGIPQQQQKQQQQEIVNESKKLKTQDTKIESRKNSSKDFAEVDTACATPPNLTIKRKRGRPRRQPQQTPLQASEQTTDINTSKSKEISSLIEPSSLQKDLKNPVISDPSDDEGPLPSAKRRCLKNSLKRKIKDDGSDSDSITASLNETQEKESPSLKPTATPRLELLKNETSTPTTSRKRKSKAESNFNPRLLLITKREQLDTDEVITKANPGTGAIQCGLCLERTQPSKWSLHKAEHYGVGWQVGEEKVHIENRSVVLSSITNYMKATGSKGLTCRMCQKVYRSALGMLMHIEACGAEVIRLECEFCKKDYTKSSLPIHMRSCYARSDFEHQKSGDNEDDINGKQEQEQIFGNSGRLKRNSTIKAENKLKVLGAELEKMTDNMVDSEKPNFDPKSRIKYVPPLEEDFSAKWSKDISTLGQASCPKSQCKFISKDVKELSEHIKNCKHIKSGYFCNFCVRLVFPTEKEAIEHVLKKHQNGRRGRKKSDDSDCNLKTDCEQSSDDDDISEGAAESELDDDVADEEEDLEDVCDSNKNGNKISKNPCSRNPCKTTTTKEVFGRRSTNLNKEVLRKWKNFLNLNHSCDPLYVEFTTQYSVVKTQDFYKYLPTQTVSMKYNFKTKQSLKSTIGMAEKNIEWSTLKRYESVNSNSNTYFFLGAPVKLCVWLPLPADVNDQYLAVVYRQDMFKFIKFTQPKQHHTIILIFKVTQNNKVSQLNVHYGLVVNDGPVHHLSFLPSGGYDASSNRLGLVAVATVNSCIKVYSLPLNVASEKTKENCSDVHAFTLIDVKPNFLLNLDILSQKEVLQNTQCLQICWSEYSGHQHIFAGFSNGFIGIWNIANDAQQNLNRFVVDNIINFVPLNYFYHGEKCVKCLAVHYDTNGPRWLAATSAYRKFVIYDIKNFTQPIIMKEDVNKNILLSMDWCPVWEVLLNSYCDTIPNNGCCVICVNPTNVKFTQNKLDFMACGVTQVHYTPVTNMCVATMNNGDIVFLDTKELHYECVVNKKFGDRRLLYAMDVKQLNGEPLEMLPKGNQKNAKVPNDWCIEDDNYKEKYGLVFEPLFKLKENDKKAYLNDNRCPPVNIIPLMRINTLRCNLNFNGRNLIALGYENGFLRLVYLNKEKVFCK